METVTDIQQSSLVIKSPIKPEYEIILSDEALCFIEKLERKFRDKRRVLLDNRIKMQQKIDKGILPNFLPETEQMTWSPSSKTSKLLGKNLILAGFVRVLLG